MSRSLSLMSILLVAGVSRAVAPPVPFPRDEELLSSIPLLHIREVERPCASGTILAPATTPERRPALFLHRPIVSCLETVIVRRTHQEKQLRLVYRRVSCRVTAEVLVPVVTRVKKLRMVYRREVRHERRPRLVYVKTTRPEKHLRLVYRPIERRVPCTHDVYVPVVKREKRLRLVYLSEEVPITRTIPRIRPHDGPDHDRATGRPHTVKEPVCEQMQITEKARRITPTIMPVEETVTSYRLERRTEMRTIKDHVLQWQLLTEEVTRYHAETRLVRERVVCYLFVPKVVEETVTNYRLEHRTITKDDYVPEWREMVEDVHTHHLETRLVRRRAEQPIVCHGEIIVPVTRVQPLPFVSTRRGPLIEPIAAPGCGAGISGGFVTPGAAD